ncbi:phage tail fiber protein, partial [Gilliamella sp. Nev3-1]|uniref:phage tail fiber protein n=2 Tax=Gilliamella TaxID=1193503 RepID=UPI001C400296
SVLKSGDYGVGAVVGAIAENFDGHLAGGFYQCSTSDFSDLQFAGDSAATLLTYPSNSKSWKVEQLSVVSSKTPKIYYRCDTRDGKQKWYEAITTANSTVDSNGFLKKASPILRLFATENIDDVDDFKKSGCSLVNDLAAGVTAKRIDIGHYEISGSLGFAKEGWYITLPEDANGNKKFFAEYSTDENNIITVKTYTRKFDFESCQIVAGEPIDITEGRWIDIRLEMPVVEVIENEEPIPSTLNPVIINNDEN